jgi:hypothetical protein
VIAAAYGLTVDGQHALHHLTTPVASCRPCSPREDSPVPDFRVADTAPEHTKLRRAGLAAAGLWALAGAFAMRELTDGWVPEYWVQSWPAGAKQATVLVDIGLWRPASRDGMPGFSFHDWGDFQRPAAKIIEERERGKERAARSRARAAERNGEPSGERNAHVQAESHDSRALTRALTPKGSSGEGSSGTERAQDRDAARPRCPEHAELPPDQRVPSCGACKQLRLAAEQQVADQAERAADERARRRALIDDCPDCDDTGMREFGDLGVGRCTHPTVTAAAS